jgi:hypothetical protein
MRRCEYDIKMCIKGAVWAMNWIDLIKGKGQVLGYCKCFNEPSISIKCWEFLDYLRTI